MTSRTLRLTIALVVRLRPEAEFQVVLERTVSPGDLLVRVEQRPHVLADLKAADVRLEVAGGVAVVQDALARLRLAVVDPVDGHVLGAHSGRAVDGGGLILRQAARLLQAVVRRGLRVVVVDVAGFPPKGAVFGDGLAHPRRQRALEQTAVK